MQNKDRKIENIPQGCYCYDEEGVCPYWSLDKTKPYQMNGFCHFLNRGDWEVEVPENAPKGFPKSAFSLLWDKVKECGVFNQDNEYNYSMYEPSFLNSLQTVLNKVICRIMLWYTVPIKMPLKQYLNGLFKAPFRLCKFCNKYYIQYNKKQSTTCCDKCKGKTK